MKRFYAAAGVLLLGTSALAWAGQADKTSLEPTKIVTEADSAIDWNKSAWDSAVWDKSTTTAESDLAMTSDGKLDTALLDKGLHELAFAETGKLQTDMGWTGDAKLQTASFDKSDMGWTGDSKLQTASFDKADMWTGDSKVQTASMDTKLDSAWSDSGKVQTASVDKVETGMGGPLEDDLTASASLAVSQPSNANPELDARGIPVISDPAFVPPGYNGVGGAVGGPLEDGDSESYTACTATVTDNCIQLYERGVRADLAGRTDLKHADTTTAVGGPYEPVDADSADLAMNGDGSLDVDKGELADTSVQTAAISTDAAVTSHSDYQGVGGPVEAQSGYPPCSPGPGDDRCIQLYERGVTGSGN
jgi:hypothetical protein